MLTADEALKLDRQALDAIAAQVRAVQDSELTASTPCAGWTVRDLVAHMNTEHAAVTGTPTDRDADPRDRFAPTATAWLDHVVAAGPTVHLPTWGTDLPAAQVMSVHAADMVVHRWDLCAALGRPCPVPGDLLDAVLAIGAEATAPGSPLVGEGRAYRPALPARSDDPPLHRLVRMFGRDPDRWVTPRP